VDEATRRIFLDAQEQVEWTLLLHFDAPSHVCPSCAQGSRGPAPGPVVAKSRESCLAVFLGRSPGPRGGTLRPATAGSGQSAPSPWDGSQSSRPGEEECVRRALESLPRDCDPAVRSLIRGQLESIPAVRSLLAHCERSAPMLLSEHDAPTTNDGPPSSPQLADDRSDPGPDRASMVVAVLGGLLHHVGVCHPGTRAVCTAVEAAVRSALFAPPVVPGPDGADPPMVLRTGRWRKLALATRADCTALLEAATLLPRLQGVLRVCLTAPDPSVSDPLRETVHETLHALDEAAAKVSSGQHCDRCLGHVPPPDSARARHACALWVKWHTAEVLPTVVSASCFWTLAPHQSEVLRAEVADLTLRMAEMEERLRRTVAAERGMRSTAVDAIRVRLDATQQQAATLQDAVSSLEDQREDGLAQLHAAERVHLELEEARMREGLDREEQQMVLQHLLGWRTGQVTHQHAVIADVLGHVRYLEQLADKLVDSLNRKGKHVQELEERVYGLEQELATSQTALLRAREQRQEALQVLRMNANVSSETVRRHALVSQFFQGRDALVRQVHLSLSLELQNYSLSMTTHIAENKKLHRDLAQRGKQLQESMEDCLKLTAAVASARAEGERLRGAGQSTSRVLAALLRHLAADDTYGPLRRACLPLLSHNLAEATFPVHWANAVLRHAGCEADVLPESGSPGPGVLASYLRLLHLLAPLALPEAECGRYAARPTTGPKLRVIRHCLLQLQLCPTVLDEAEATGAFARTDVHDWPAGIPDWHFAFLALLFTRFCDPLPEDAVDWVSADARELRPAEWRQRFTQTLREAAHWKRSGQKFLAAHQLLLLPRVPFASAAGFPMSPRRASPRGAKPTLRFGTAAAAAFV